LKSREEQVPAAFGSLGRQSLRGTLEADAGDVQLLMTFSMHFSFDKT
jgi:hypothetical protein